MNSRQKEELANVLSHAIGIGLAVAGAALLITFGAIYGDAWHVVSFSVFGACLVILYTASTVFHSARNARLRYALNKLDHSSIFILMS